MITKITGLQHHDIDKISDSLVIGNAVFVKRQFELDKEPEKGCDGIAYACTCKNVLIGYLSLIRTLRKYYREANNMEDQKRTKEWGEATKAIRNQLFLDYGNTGQEEWVTRVAGLLYFRNGDWLEFDKYGILPPDEQETWQLRQAAINFDNVEAF